MYMHVAVILVYGLSWCVAAHFVVQMCVTCMSESFSLSASDLVHLHTCACTPITAESADANHSGTVQEA